MKFLLTAIAAAVYLVALSLAGKLAGKQMLSILTPKTSKAKTVRECEVGCVTSGGALCAIVGDELEDFDDICAFSLTQCVHRVKNKTKVEFKHSGPCGVQEKLRFAIHGVD